MSAPSVPSSPAAIKKLEKQLKKEAKREDVDLKHALKDLQAAEKLKAKAHKSASKAEETIEKITKIETATLKALNKATHEHDAAVVELRNAERDADLRRQEDERLAADLEAKKARAAERLTHMPQEERKNMIRELLDGGGGLATPESTLSDSSVA
ncbi:hypothetical protein GGX14DRAFT_616628 [Mycena pura]|uniref:Uncharacterized protein n=1 Tax=Mycena pura TaxID=153505 RepID=A0AAD6YUI4_9AGAR|nr:hypothetical protein GGX14DRAFT_616628 [Mycena pura]